MSIRFHAHACIWLCALLGFAIPIGAQANYVTTLQTTADNWVARNLPTQSNPTSSTLWMRGPIGVLAGDDKESFVEFYIPDIHVDTAVVRFMAAGFGGANPNQLEISLVPEPVDVNSLTWNTRPTYGAVLATADVWNGLTEVELPAAMLPVGEAVVLRLRFNRDGWGYFQSLESGGMIPELQLVTTPFTDVTTSELQNISTWESGFAWGDYDGDGDDDVYVVGEGGGHKLIRNDGAGGFTDVTPGILTDSNAGRGATWADYDNDGDLDLFRAGYPNKLFNNEGGGVFVDSTSSFPGGGGHSLSNCWADFDLDGDLDVYSTGETESFYFRNDGGGAFTNATTGDLIQPGGGSAWGTNVGDYDNDGDPDMFILAGLSTLLRNDGGGVFTDASVAPLRCCDGIAVCWGDYDNDNDLDICESSTLTGSTVLFRNDGGGTWTRAEPSAFLSIGAQGAAWGDYDNDGDLDLYLAAGTNYLFRNDLGGVFTDVTTGPLADSEFGRACDWVDYDDDGDLDLFMVNFTGPNKLLRNNLVSNNHWLQVDLVGNLSNLWGVGSRIRVVAGGVSQIREVTVGTAARTQGSLTAAFGLGTSSVVDTIEVAWPSGVVTELYSLSGDQLVVISESGVTVTVSTIPEGLDVEVNGDTQTAPWQFATGVGSSNTIGVVSPQVRGDTSFVFAGWSDGGAITHDVIPTSDTTFTASFDYYFAYGKIDSVVDVPQDQGGWVRIHFLRSIYDDTTETTNPIANYAVHRRVDSPALVADLLSHGERVAIEDIELTPVTSDNREIGPSKNTVVLTRLDDRYFRVIERTEAAAPPGVWEVLGTVPARQQDHYIYLAPTLADSSESLTYSVYFIAAHTTTPSVYFDSPPDSGYSVDNIAPGVPPAFSVAYNTGSGNTLTWDPVTDNDLQYYKVYRGTEMDFTPSPGNLVDVTAVTNWSDPDYDGWQVYYRVTAVDDAGNEGEPTDSGPVSGAGDEPILPERFALYQNVPNPFNPTTMIRYDVPPGGGHVTLNVYDVAGKLVRTLVDGLQAPGVKTVVWNGSNDRGSRVATGVYFYRLTAPGFDQTRKMVLIQ